MKLLYSFLKDMKLSLNSFYFYIELIMAFIFVIVMLFIVPEKRQSRVTVYANLKLEGIYKEKAKEALSTKDIKLTLLESEEAVKRNLEEDRSSVGLIISMKDNRVVYNYILQGYEDRKFRNILKTSITSGFSSQASGYTDVTQVVTLNENSEKLSLRLNMLPVFLSLNAAFMGLFIIASYIFLDKEEGTIKAFAVTPARVWHYLLSKLGILLMTGLVSGLITTIFIAGRKADYLQLILLLIATNGFGSALGLFIASFFNTMTKAMGWLYMSVIVLSFSVVSYYMPAFAPLIIRVLPSYPMLFAFRETLLRAGDISFIYTNILAFAAAGVLLFLFANYRFKKNLTV